MTLSDVINNITHSVTHKGTPKLIKTHKTILIYGKLVENTHRDFLVSLENYYFTFVVTLRNLFIFLLVVLDALVIIHDSL